MEKPIEGLMIVGPTASGKSALSLALAKKYRVEIISVDSALVYRGMDIGSAKPTVEEMQVCPHHLIDIRSPWDPYSAADFASDVMRLIPRIRARGAFPLLVGGTMLYAKALRDGLNDLPSTLPRLRARIQEEGERLGWPVMHARLARIDPTTAARLQPLDKQRIGRALEVYRMTGKPLSSFHTQPKRPLVSLGYIGLMPGNRALLHERIAQRFDVMLEQGFLDEVKALMQRSGFDPDAPSMRSVGYRQAIDYLEGKLSYQEFRRAGIAATRQLAKRQMTWMRSMRDLFLLDPFEDDLLEKCRKKWQEELKPFLR